MFFPEKTVRSLMWKSNLLWPTPLKFKAILGSYPFGIPNFYRFSIINPIHGIWRIFVYPYGIRPHSKRGVGPWNGKGPPQHGVHCIFLEKYSAPHVEEVLFRSKGLPPVWNAVEFHRGRQKSVKFHVWGWWLKICKNSEFQRGMILKLPWISRG